ncbi:uncharacterized protein MELLADRAFT_87547 [Melampsora larici-populina 98AG31]|uniref:Secreted protein n=1 Tax=Melampsora larici-populina (strain 98AG31 / pathotype 3-4-7) TaxID=747676 RepID=F4RNQ8_MELLP|nr:uncharacterized protein MELLADRAFT_87547 [Melampsora larici-populina 98AG31]EGG06054.1 secreted protein [Melampsora larici-populina 98AG31]
MNVLFHRVFILVIIQHIIGGELLTQSLPNTQDTLDPQSTTEIAIGTKRCIGKDCNHLVNRRSKTIKKRQCTTQSPPTWGLATWIPGLFHTTPIPGDLCPPKDNTASSIQKVGRPGTSDTRITAASGNVKDETKEDQQRWLDAHNKYRATYKVAPLVWNDQLTSAAKSEVSPCVWEHSRGAYGENIAAGQPDIERVVSDWVIGPGEKSVYNPSNPTFSHFTQVVWSSTKSISCSRTSCVSMKGISLPQSPIIFWACEYFPPGNVMGQFNQNVKAGPGGIPL